MADLRKLKQEALEAAAAGNWRKAATCYANLERVDASDPAWGLKLGECLRKLGNDAEAIKSFSRAAAAYAKQDVLLKAIAVCKIILAIDPKHTRALDLLASLHAAQEGYARPEQAPAARPPRGPSPGTTRSGFRSRRALPCRQPRQPPRAGTP